MVKFEIYMGVILYTFYSEHFQHWQPSIKTLSWAYYVLV